MSRGEGGASENGWFLQRFLWVNEIKDLAVAKPCCKMFA